MILTVATRSDDKLREVREIIADLLPIHLQSLSDAGVPEDPAEEGIECFGTFEENALAKAQYFARRTATPVLADDSGLCVDALGGAPGVLSKRFSVRSDLHGVARDEANNETLLEQLRNVEDRDRSARYVCALAYAAPGQESRVFTGSCAGRILRDRHGTGGFGYDPLFWVPSEGKTFGEIPAHRKNQISHRARALQQFAAFMNTQLDGSADRR